MLFDLSYLTEKALEGLVSRGIEKREYIIDEDDKDRANKYLLIGVILFAIFSLSVMFLVKREDGDKAFLCIVLSMLAFTIIPLILAKKVSKAKEKQAIVQFHNKSKEFFYSTMPKNIAIR